MFLELLLHLGCYGKREFSASSYRRISYVELDYIRYNVSISNQAKFIQCDNAKLFRH